MARKCVSSHALLLGLLVLGLSPINQANHDAKRLYDDLLRKSGYNRLIRPALNSTSTLTVKMGLRLSQLNDVDEKNEIVTTNVWVIHQWTDHSLVWDPQEYGAVDTLYVPSLSIWLPDIVLYNNADGDYNVTLMTKATLQANGTVLWEPPAIYKSYCNINVEFFPFDQQECTLKFGSWTYDGTKVDLEHVWMEQLGLKDTLTRVERAMDLRKFYPSVEWDLMAVPAIKTNKYYPCCDEPYPDITFNFTIRRKTLSYTINLIIPCVSINMLTCLAFYMPSDSGEKISLSITILLSLSMFQLLLMELVPATSAAIPLLGKYIIFTMCMVAVSVFVSVVTLNVNFRSTSTHEMPNLTRKVFLQILPRILFMRRPTYKARHEELEDFDMGHADIESSQTPYHSRLKQSNRDSDIDDMHGHHPVSSNFIGFRSCMGKVDFSNFCEACSQRRIHNLPPNIGKAIGGVCFVAKHMLDDNKCNRVKEDWRYVALVVDRLFLYIYLTVCGVGIVGIIMRAPMLFDPRRPLAFGEKMIQTNQSLGCGGGLGSE